MPDIDWRLLDALVRHDPVGRGLCQARDAAGLLYGDGELRLAAEEIAERAATVVIVTGFAVKVDNRITAETDGPAGAIFLARMLESAGIAAEIVADPYVAPILAAGLKFAGPVFRQVTEIASTHNDDSSRTAVAAWRGEFFKRRRCSHLVFVERVGPSRAADGACRNMRGESIDAFTSPLFEMLQPADARERSASPRSIGIVDGGNEVGCGRFSDATLAEVLGPLAHIGCRTRTDLLVPAGVSNWGAYALGAAVAALKATRNRERKAAAALQAWDAAKHRKLLEAVVAAGAVDGVTKRAQPTVDGIPTDAYLQHFERILAAAGSNAPA